MQSFRILVLLFLSWSAIHKLNFAHSFQFGDGDQALLLKIVPEEELKKDKSFANAPFNARQRMKEQSKSYVASTSLSQHPLVKARKRSKFEDSEISCGCRAEFRPLVLGSQYYPAVIPAAFCDPKSCNGTALACQQIFYKMRILRRRNIAKLEEVDIFMPEALRRDWLLEELDIAVACECTQP